MSERSPGLSPNLNNLFTWKCPAGIRDEYDYLPFPASGVRFTAFGTGTDMTQRFESPLRHIAVAGLTSHDIINAFAVCMLAFSHLLFFIFLSFRLKDSGCLCEVLSNPIGAFHVPTLSTGLNL